MKVRDWIMAFGTLFAFGGFLSVIVWKVLTFRPMSVAVTAARPENETFRQMIVNTAKPFFTWFNDYALVIILAIVLLMAAIDFIQNLRQKKA
jgi:NADH:ubiquinone oxidoreductase subunit 6 (subunit J)